MVENREGYSSVEEHLNADQEVAGLKSPPFLRVALKERQTNEHVTISDPIRTLPPHARLVMWFGGGVTAETHNTVH